MGEWVMVKLSPVANSSSTADDNETEEKFLRAALLSFFAILFVVELANLGMSQRR
jgi:hypothetical protein